MSANENAWMVELPASALFSPDSYAGTFHKLGLFHKRLNKAVKVVGMHIWYYDSTSGLGNSGYQLLFIGPGRELRALLSMSNGAISTLNVFGFQKLGVSEKDVKALAKALTWEHYKGRILVEDMAAYHERKRKEDELEAR